MNYCISRQLILFYFNMISYNASIIFDTQWINRERTSCWHAILYILLFILAISNLISLIIRFRKSDYIRFADNYLRVKQFTTVICTFCLVNYVVTKQQRSSWKTFSAAWYFPFCSLRAGDIFLINSITFATNSFTAIAPVNPLKLLS